MSLENEQLKKQWEQIQVFDGQAAGNAAVARFFASQLYYEDRLGLQNESALIKARQHYLTLAPTRYTYSSYYCFENILAEALLLTGYYEEAMFYLNELVEKLKAFIPSYMDIALLETIHLFKAICYMQANKKRRRVKCLSGSTRRSSTFFQKNTSRFYTCRLVNVCEAASRKPNRSTSSSGIQVLSA